MGYKLPEGRATRPDQAGLGRDLECYGVEQQRTQESCGWPTLTSAIENGRHRNCVGCGKAESSFAPAIPDSNETGFPFFIPVSHRGLGCPRGSLPALPPLRNGGTTIDSCAAIRALQFLGREVALRGLLLENAHISRGNRGFQTADMEKFDVGKRHFSTFQGDATMIQRNPRNDPEQHDIPPSIGLS